MHERLGSRDPSSLTGVELDLLADALFWLDRPEESLGRRRDAYAAHVDVGAAGAAALAAWRLFYDHHLVGEVTLANGWLERARRHAASCTGDVEQGWIAVADADRALERGDLASALAHADRALGVGTEAADADLTAMALQSKGRVLVASGRVQDGLAVLDDAMVAAVNGELTPLYTGWVYCNVLSTCHDLGDLRRAADWSDAAMRWCDDLDEGRLYPGICRVHAAELACSRGVWANAEAQAEQASAELVAHDPRFAGEAFYLRGDLCRLRGDLEPAQEAFTRAHELGRLPQPGLALLRLAQGRPGAALKALRLALRTGPSAPLRRAQLLAALVQTATRAGDDRAAREAADELAQVAAGTGSPFLDAMAAAADGTAMLAAGASATAVSTLRTALTTFQDLRFPYHAAEVHEAIGIACHEAGDDDTAELELGAALTTFERLGARLDVDRVRRRVEGVGRPVTPLSDREVEVLRLVAAGGTNRSVGEALFVSEHTVARHLSNIFTKIGVASRAAATAWAYEHGVV